MLLLVLREIEQPAAAFPAPPFAPVPVRLCGRRWAPPHGSLACAAPLGVAHLRKAAPGTAQMWSSALAVVAALPLPLEALALLLPMLLEPIALARSQAG